MNKRKHGEYELPPLLHEIEYRGWLPVFRSLGLVQQRKFIVMVPVEACLTHLENLRHETTLNQSYSVHLQPDIHPAQFLMFYRDPTLQQKSKSQFDAVGEIKPDPINAQWSIVTIRSYPRTSLKLLGAGSLLGLLALYAIFMMVRVSMAQPSMYAVDWCIGGSVLGFGSVACLVIWDALRHNNQRTTLEFLMVYLDRLGLYRRDHQEYLAREFEIARQSGVSLDIPLSKDSLELLEQQNLESGKEKRSS